MQPVSGITWWITTFFWGEVIFHRKLKLICTVKVPIINEVKWSEDCTRHTVILGDLLHNRIRIAISYVFLTLAHYLWCMIHTTTVSNGHSSVQIKKIKDQKKTKNQLQCNLLSMLTTRQIFFWSNVLVFLDTTQKSWGLYSFNAKSIPALVSLRIDYLISAVFIMYTSLIHSVEKAIHPIMTRECTLRRGVF